MRTASISALALLALTGAARAFDVRHFMPAIDPEGYFSVHSARTHPAGRYHLAVWYAFADEPEGVAGGDLDGSAHTMDVVASYSLLERFEVGIGIPVSYVPKAPEDGVGIDDIRLHGKIQILDARLTPFGFALLPFVELPTGDESRLTSNGAWDGGFLAVADTLLTRRFRAAANLGLRINDDPFGDDDDPEEIPFGVGLGFLAFRDVDARIDGLEMLVEVAGSTSADDVFEENPVEVLGGLRFWSPMGFVATFGLGGAVSGGPGSADVRIVTGITWTPPPPPAPPGRPVPPGPADEPLSGVIVTDEEIVPLEPILFAPGESRLSPEAYQILDQAAEVARRRGASLRVEGHTDPLGSVGESGELSRRRARTVADALVSRGVPAERIEIVGIGDTRPVATNDTPAGRARNRRTEIHFVLP